jgi:hypothetical protein
LYAYRVNVAIFPNPPKSRGEIAVGSRRKYFDRIDFDAIHAAADVRLLAEKYLEPGRRRDRFVCPACHEDNLTARPKVWGCWSCSAHDSEGAGRDAIGLVALAAGLSRIDAAKRLAAELGIGPTPASWGAPNQATKQARPKPPEPPKPYENESWQAGMLHVIDQSHLRLMARADDLARQAWDYLTIERKLKPETIEKYRLGLNPDGLESDEMMADGKRWYMQPGITIPWLAGSRVIAVNVRKFHKRGSKYLMATGSSRQWLYPHAAKWSEWRGPVVVVEGEFDAMIGNQELGGLLPVVTLGGSQCKPEDTRDATWLGRSSHLLLAVDADAAGQGCRDMWQDFSPKRARPVELPTEAKDITEAVQAGHDLAVWLNQVCEGLQIDLRAWPGLVYELPLGTLRGRLMEPKDGEVDPYETEEKAAIMAESCG